MPNKISCHDRAARRPSTDKPARTPHPHHSTTPPPIRPPHPVSPRGPVASSCCRGFPSCGGDKGSRGTDKGTQDRRFKAAGSGRCCLFLWWVSKCVGVGMGVRSRGGCMCFHSRGHTPLTDRRSGRVGKVRRSGGGWSGHPAFVNDGELNRCQED